MKILTVAFMLLFNYLDTLSKLYHCLLIEFSPDEAVKECVPLKGVHNAQSAELTRISQLCTCTFTFYFVFTVCTYRTYIKKVDYAIQDGRLKRISPVVTCCINWSYLAICYFFIVYLLYLYLYVSVFFLHFHYVLDSIIIAVIR